MSLGLSVSLLLVSPVIVRMIMFVIEDRGGGGVGVNVGSLYEGADVERCMCRKR